MGRRPCCEKEGMKTGAWTAEEDDILATYVKAHGLGKWREMPQKAGLRRCGKSCRLRWMNYLRPNINHGNFSCDEEDLIIRLHMLLGSRWSLIAGRLPGRTDNQIKNYWKTKLARSRRVGTGTGSSRFLIAPDTGSHDIPAASGSCETGQNDTPPRADSETGQKDAPPRVDPDSAGSASLAALVSPLVGSHDEPCVSGGGGGGGDWMDDVRALASFLESDDEWLRCQTTEQLA